MNIVTLGNRISKKIITIGKWNIKEDRHYGEMEDLHYWEMEHQGKSSLLGNGTSRKIVTTWQ